MYLVSHAKKNADTKNTAMHLRKPDQFNSLISNI